MNINNITEKDCNIFVPPIKYGKVIDIINGNTIMIATTLSYDDEYYKFIIKIKNIICPNLKSKSDSERICGIIAKDFLKDILLNKIVSISDISTDSYGTILAYLKTDDLYMNDLLINENLAIEYHGGKKPDIDWFEYYKEKHTDYTTSNSPYKKLECDFNY